MHRFYLPPEQRRSETLILSEREGHHAANVLRIRAGERVTVLDGAGTELLCLVLESAKKHVQLQILERKLTPPLPFSLTLLQAIPKGKIIEDIIQKATELGVARIVPLLTERVTTRLDASDLEQKREKWQQVAIEAIKQCGAAWLPKVETPVTPAELLTRKESFELPLIASLQSGAQHPRMYFRQFESEHGRKPRSACVWIGPEGDLTPEEVSRIAAAGAKPITLGRLVLRVETAAMYCLSVLNYELQS